MMKGIFTGKDVVGRFITVLLIASGFIFAIAFNGFVVQTEAKSCCGGGIDFPIFTSGSNNDDCACNAGGCDASNCDNCTPKKCPDNATCNEDENGAAIDCGCDAKCNSNACNNDC